MPNGSIPVDEPVNFEVKTDETAKNYNLGYEWTVSSGRMLKGQGTSAIEFSAGENDSAININVSVKITGLPKDCSNTVSDSIGVIHIPESDPFDEIGKISLNDYKARLDSFLARVEGNSNYKGLIQLKFNKSDSQKYKKLLVKNIYNYLEFRKFDLTRISLAIYEDDYEEQTTLWIASPGADLPKSVRKDYKIIKAEELLQKLNQLFPKK